MVNSCELQAFADPHEEVAVLLDLADDVVIVEQLAEDERRLVLDVQTLGLTDDLLLHLVVQPRLAVLTNTPTCRCLKLARCSLLHCFVV